MKLYISRLIAFCFVTFVATSSFANVGDINVIKAREAYDKENIVKLTEYANKLTAQKHILAPYVHYWLMSLNMTGTDNQAISRFLAQHEDYAFAPTLRASFLRKLGKQKDWTLFAHEKALYQSSNTAVDCLAAEFFHVEHPQASLVFAKSLWLTDKDQPNDCNTLFDAMQASGDIDEAAIWQRFRMVTAKNRVSLAKSIIMRSKSYKAIYSKLLTNAYKSPETFLKKRRASFRSRFGHEVNLYALVRLSQKDTANAVAAYQKIVSLLKPDEKAYFYATLGMHAAKRHEEKATKWYQKADVNTMNDEQISWYARAALRQSDWRQLLTVITQMPTDIADEARWRYWKARALIALKQHQQQAVDMLTRLAVERHYYGWLAQDELSNYTPPKVVHYSPTKAEIAAIGKIAGVERAAVLLHLELRWQGKLEWKKVIEKFDDKQLLAAAEYASQQGWNDLAINTADDTRGIHDFSLRYLMPYKQLMTNAAKAHSIDVTWVHGITRQESRFMHYAKSHVGAAGLMQLMPTTARWAAKKAGVKNYKRSMIDDLDTNVTIGTYYLRHTLDVMNGNKVMATAGYNAGPSRAKKWLANRPLEGAIYAETIPFNETRVYVQRVMANMHMYNQQLGIKNKTLKQLMGQTPAKPLS